MFCPNCGLELPDDVKDTCPACSYKLPINSQGSSTVSSNNPINEQNFDTINAIPFNSGISTDTISEQNFNKPDSEKISATSISNFLVWSIISTVFCCLPFGIVALVYSNKVNTFLIDKEYEKALHASNLAKIWNVVGTVCGVVMYILYLTLFASSIFQFFGRF